MHDIKFSLIVPVYNVETYIERCIESLYSQSYTNFEVICVNDGSTDHSPSLLEYLSSKHPGMLVIQQENKGLGEARNTGVTYAHGEYIWFIDSDDWIEPDALDALAHFITQENFPDIVLFDSFKVIGGVKQTHPHIPLSVEKQLSKEKYLQYLLLHQAHYFGWGKVFKASVYLKSGFHFPIGFYEDVALLPFYKQHVNSVGYLHKEVYNYYIRGNSIMRTYDRRILVIFDRFAMLKETFREPKWKKYLASFFYEFSITKKRQAELANDNQVLSDFWTIYSSYQRSYGYISGCGLFNPHLTIRAKIKMILYLILHY